VRKVIAVSQPDLDADFHGRPLRDVLLEPTRIYVKPLLAALDGLPGAVKGLAHITGGGLIGNVPRILGERLVARIDAGSWTLPPLFQWLQEAGQIARQEMFRVFNCGIGMVVVTAAADADAVGARLAAAGETVYRIGRIDRREAGEEQIIIV
jgi:phosphoribosylformylglycinamidine cyclo-ligase